MGMLEKYHRTNRTQAHSPPYIANNITSQR
jgi:hypothetical protein